MTAIEHIRKGKGKRTQVLEAVVMNEDSRACFCTLWCGYLREAGCVRLLQIQENNDPSNSFPS